MSTKKVIIRKRVMHKKAVFEKYAALAANGAIAAETLIVPKSGMLEVSVDGEIVGAIDDMKESDLPALYDIRVIGVGSEPNTLLAEITDTPAGAAKMEKNATSGVPGYESEIEKAAENSKLPKEQVEARVKYMIQCRVFPRVIKMILAKYRTWGDRALCEPSTLYVDTDPDAPANESIINRALVRILTRGAVIFEGPKSTGKNTLMESIAYMFACPYERFTANERSLQEDIFGSRSTDNSAAEALTTELAEKAVRYQNGEIQFMEDAAEYDRQKAKASCIRIVYDLSIFVKWAQRGGVLNWDEINACAPNLLQQAINSAADKEKVLIVPGYGRVKLHEDCILLAGMNPGYDGMNDLNPATSSRFAHIRLDYPKSVKEALKANFPAGTLPEKYYTACDRLYKKFRETIRAGKISDTCLNIRGMVSALEGVTLLPEETNLRIQILDCVVGGCDVEEQLVLEQMVNDTIGM